MATDKTRGTTAAPAKKTYIMDPAVWDKSSSPEFGGQSDILELEVGEVAGPLTYIGFTNMKLENGDVKVHQATTPDSSTVRCPIAASFLRAFDQAGIVQGDQFAIKRNEDTEKKTGVGKGQTMHIFSVKVLKKAPANS